MAPRARGGNAVAKPKAKPKALAHYFMKKQNEKAEGTGKEEDKEPQPLPAQAQESPSQTCRTLRLNCGLRSDRDLGDRRSGCELRSVSAIFSRPLQSRRDPGMSEVAA